MRITDESFNSQRDDLVKFAGDCVPVEETTFHYYLAARAVDLAEEQDQAEYNPYETDLRTMNRIRKMILKLADNWKPELRQWYIGKFAWRGENLTDSTRTELNTLYLDAGMHLYGDEVPGEYLVRYDGECLAVGSEQVHLPVWKATSEDIAAKTLELIDRAYLNRYHTILQ